MHACNNNNYNNYNHHHQGALKKLSSSSKGLCLGLGLELQRRPDFG
jgi:hypothetical protein